jgi:hypothetical protein
MILTGENRRTQRKTCPSATSLTTSSKWTDPSANPVLCDEKPATSCLTLGTAWSRLTMCDCPVKPDSCCTEQTRGSIQRAKRSTVPLWISLPAERTAWFLWSPPRCLVLPDSSVISTVLSGTTRQFCDLHRAVWHYQTVLWSPPYCLALPDSSVISTVLSGTTRQFCDLHRAVWHYQTVLWSPPCCLALPDNQTAIFKTQSVCSAILILKCVPSFRKQLTTVANMLFRPIIGNEV